MLRKREFRDFRVAVRNSGWPARNRACARNFWHYCDLDSDSKLTKNEFRTCLGIDINSESKKELFSNFIYTVFIGYCDYLGKIAK